MSYTFTATEKLVAELYVSILGRAPDVEGLRYWANNIDHMGWTQTTVAQSFFDQPETKAKYPSYYTVSEFVTVVYGNVLGRAPDTEGLTYWTNQLNSGAIARQDFITAIVNAVTGPYTGTEVAQHDLDVARFDNLLTVSAAYVNAQLPASLGGSNLPYNEAAAAAVIDGVTAEQASVTEALNEIQTLVGTSGQTFTLTLSTDTVTGTSGNDTINAPLAVNVSTGIATEETFTSFDNIDGGAGTDTLNIFAAGAYTATTAATVKNVENVVVNADNSVTLDASNYSGLQSLTVAQAGGAVTLTTKGNATSVSAKTSAGAIGVTDSATTDTLASVSLDGFAAASTVASDALTSLSVANASSNVTVTAAAGTRALGVTVNNVTGGTIRDDSATTVTVTGSGAASSGFTLTTDAATSIAFAGDKTVSLALTDTGSNSATVTSITSTNTAGVTITSSLGTSIAFTGGAGKDSVTVGATTKAIAMGAGDDTVNVTLSSGDLGTGGTIDGGDGTDTLGLTAADAAAAATALGAKLTSFERIALSSATSQTIDMSKLNNINYVSEAGTGNTLTLNNFANNGTFVFTDASTATAINVKDAATGTSDVLNLVVTGSAAVVAGTVTVANVETINLNADDTAASPGGSFAHTMTLTAAAAKTLNVTGDAGATLTLTGSTALETIDTSGVTKGAVSVTTVATNKSVTMTGGNTDTTFDASSITDNTKVATITTGSGDDTITGGAGDDVINAGNGTNSITGGGGKDTMTGGTGVDTYVYSLATDSQGTKVDVITNFQVGTGGDVIDLSGVTGGWGAYLGVANGYGAVLTSLTGAVGETVLDASTSTLYVDVDGDAALTSADMAIQLTGVTSGLVAANFTF
ncbi:DUF4214 domain-containing protein [Thiofaba sp. EF100]|uniref:DUF4214 domain-containing protein n=1 Tax=Thiofaba sp. EF100 TaxID=3121274 RepID=UPI00322154CC